MPAPNMCPEAEMKYPRKVTMTSKVIYLTPLFSCNIPIIFGAAFVGQASNVFT